MLQNSAFVAVPAAMAAAADLPKGGLVLLSMFGKKVGSTSNIGLGPIFSVLLTHLLSTFNITDCNGT